MPGDQPSDIYETVARDLVAELEEASSLGDKAADKWHWRNLRMPADEGDPDGRPQWMVIDRDACKLAVMTTPYGVTSFGIQKQLFEKALSEPLSRRASSPLSGSHIREPRAFVAKLRNGNHSLSQFLWERFSLEERKAMSGAGASLQSLRVLLGKALKRIINGPLIFEVQRFTEIELSDEAKKLTAKPEELFDASYNLTAEDKRAVDADERNAYIESRKIDRVNRLLLEDAYPKEIKRSQPDRWRSCGYLAGKLRASIDRLVDPGNKLAEWFQDIADQSANAGHGVRWTAPSGFPVLQESWVPKKKPISAGKIEVVTYVPSDKRDGDAEKRKIVANFIHSLDAAHMVLTVRRLRSEGLKHFGVIHDCFAVHACDVDQLSKALRKEFVGMYRIPDGGSSLLERFRREQSKNAEMEFPFPPPPGDFDIEKVLESEYFFC